MTYARRVKLPGGLSLVIVDTSDVVRILGRSDATSCMRGLTADFMQRDRLFEDMRNRLGLRRGESSDILLDEAARALESGRLMLVQIREAPRVLDEPEVVDIASLAGDDDVEEASTWIEIELRGRDGTLYPGSTLRIQLPDDTERDVEVDARSIWRGDGLGQAGMSQVWLRDLAERIGSARNFEQTDGVIQPEGRQVYLLTNRRHILEVRQHLLRVRTETLRFAHDSVLLVPLVPGMGPAPALATFAGRIEGDATLRALVAGHASRTGSVSHNDDISHLRATGVARFFANDRDGWVDLAAEYGSPADVQRMLAYLASEHQWPTDPGRTDGELDEGSEAAVRSFQYSFNVHYDEEIEEDGKITRETLGALFDVFYEELSLLCEAVGVEDLTTVASRLQDDHVLGAGIVHCDDPKFAEASNEVGQRRIDLILIPAEIDWAPPASSRDLIESSLIDIIDIDARLSRPRELRVQLVDHYGRVLVKEPYVVRTDEEERRGQTDEEGLLVEIELRGQSPTITLDDGSIVIFDAEYFDRGEPRRKRGGSATSFEADVDDEQSDAPLPATSEELERDDDPGEEESTSYDDASVEPLQGETDDILDFVRA